MTKWFMKPAGFFRRLLALLYDTLAIFGILFTLSLALVFINNGYGEKGTFVSYFQLLITISTGPIFYTFFWIRNNGQTIGMQAWKIKLISTSKRELTIVQCLLRCLFSILLFPGYLWILVSKEKKSWADVFSRTKILNVK